MILRILIPFLFIFLGIHWIDFKKRHPDSFSVDKIALDVEGPFLCEGCPNLENNLQQPFFYLGRGTQSIAFESKDQRYVIKFFLKKGIGGKKRYRIPSFFDLFPSHCREKAKKKRERREKCLTAALQRYGIAFEHLREETGLLAVHLRSSPLSLPRCRVFDRYGTEHCIDLNRASFVLQKRAKPIQQIFSEWGSQEKVLCAIEELLERRAKKGFSDLKRGILFDGNYGIVGEQAIFFDPGRMVFSEKIKNDPEPEIQRMKKRLRDHFSKKR